MQRRSFLKGAGVVTVAVVGGGVWRAYDQGVFSVGKGPAYEPWKDWRKDSNDGGLALVRAAILADLRAPEVLVWSRQESAQAFLEIASRWLGSHWQPPPA
jgi:hypothetical protein